VKEIQVCTARKRISQTRKIQEESSSGGRFGSLESGQKVQLYDNKYKMSNGGYKHRQKCIFESLKSLHSATRCFQLRSHTSNWTLPECEHRSRDEQTNRQEEDKGGQSE
jgi:hypothetical protein